MSAYVGTPDVLGADPPLEWTQCEKRLLAEGDSWFTMGTLNPFASSNLLQQLDLRSKFGIVSCAYPGDRLQKMVEFWRDPHFAKLISEEHHAWPWDGIVLSAGGNDLIAAAQVPAVDRNGLPIQPHDRILLTPQEADSGFAPERYISEAGWKRFVDYLEANFREIVKKRDEPRSPNRGRATFLHTYALPTVRPAGGYPGHKGWLFSAFVTAGIPADDRQPVSDCLFKRFREVLLALDENSGSATALPAVHVFDSAAVEIDPAAPGTTGTSGHWVNEIHLTRAGYKKLGKPFGEFIENRISS